MVSLHAGRPLSDHARDRRMAAAGFPKGYPARSVRMGRYPAAALYKNGRSGAGVYRQLRQYGDSRCLRLEQLRNFLLRVRVHRLPDPGLLPGEVPAAVELEAYAGRYRSDVSGRLIDHFVRLRADPAIFSGRLRLP